MDGSKSRKSGQLNSAPSRTGSFTGGATSHSGPVNTTARNIPLGGMSASVINEEDQLWSIE
ncbi:hypothetical protein Lal_00046375 [Lupinus albus]|nr:hypothetical protein Lal_00046375 [Lupinus albus]